MVAAAAVAAAVVGVSAPCANAEFPYPHAASNPDDYTQYKRPGGAQPVPNDLGGDVWKFASTPDGSPESQPNNNTSYELGGVRGSHVLDSADVAQGWRTTTGRPDVTIAVLDSGIKWNDAGAMNDVRRKVRLNRGELSGSKKPRNDNDPKEGVDCTGYDGNGLGGYDLNKDGVFNVMDYACDNRVNPTPAHGVGPPGVLDPQDIIIAFSDHSDDDGNGFTDDIAGWDFLDNDNDPYDDVQYGHGTGEARDSTAEANNGDDLGTCPNCTVVPLRVGDSFVADVNRFAQATIYAADNGVMVVQEALGSMNNSSLARDAVDYAYEHGVTVIASAADEAAQHNNWPSSNPHVILVNSVTNFDSTVTPLSRSYLQFNGCTNFNSKITLAIPSASCSSEATGRSAGMAGLIYSAAINARAGGQIPNDHPDCRHTDNSSCVITPNEVRQLMASGSVGATDQADDVNFARDPVTGTSTETSCSPAPVAGCTDPFLAAPPQRPAFSPIATTQSYPARKGHDQFYGYGRVNMAKALDATAQGNIPPEVEITSPEWYELVDPSKPSVAVKGQVFARGNQYTCKVFVAPGSYPADGTTTGTPPGDFKQVTSSYCDGSTQRTGSFDGTLTNLDLGDLKSRFPPETQGTGFTGREPGGGAQTHNGRPDTAPYGFVVKVEAYTTGSPQLTGRDRRLAYLHKDQDLIDGFPRELVTDGESSPVFVDLDGDNRNEMLLGSSDGFVHAFRRDGSELPGWPVRTDQLPLHQGGHAFQSGEVSSNFGGAVITAIASADLNHDGDPEVVAADLEGKVYVWNSSGSRLHTMEANPAFSGKPLSQFVNARNGKLNRTQHGFLGSPVLADLDGDKKLEIVAAGMDRHVYAWHDDGSPVSGFPVLVVDPSKVQSIDPTTQQVTFKPGVGAGPQQGGIVDTPAVADLNGDRKPEIVVGTNEEYDAAGDGGLNASPLSSAAVQVLSNPSVDLLKPANGRVYAIKPAGDTDSDPNPSDALVAGWPAKVGIFEAELLPVVGEGINGSPVVASFTCPSGGAGAKIGVIPAAGAGYIFNSNGSSCYGNSGGADVNLDTDTGNPGTDATKLAAVGLPAFGDLGGPAPTFLAPAAGAIRALDAAANEYQGGSDVVAAWDSTTGHFRPGWPAVVNDLQFLTGPAVADLDGLPGDEVVAGTASMDLAAFNAAGTPVNPSWPKLTGDWTISTPLIGSFGTVDTDPGAHKVVVGITRRGTVLAYSTDAQSCTPSSSPRFHHDNANSGDFARDAVAPGKAYDISREDRMFAFKAPGDDLLCGTATKYKVVQSDGDITAANFDSQEEIQGSGNPGDTTNVPTPGAAGAAQAFVLPQGAKQNIAIRAEDDQGNVGRIAVVSGNTPSGGSGTSSPGGSDVPINNVASAPTCLARKLTVGTSSLGPIRLGDTLAKTVARAGMPSKTSTRSLRYCVKGGGKVGIALSSKGRVELVASTAKRHEARGLGRGDRARGLARRLRRLTDRVLAERGKSGRLYAVRRGKVSYVGVATSQLLRSPSGLKSALHAAGLKG